jgi:hypothetical protein
MKRKIKRNLALVLLIIGCILFVGNASGQTTGQTGGEVGGMGYSILGTSVLKVDALNERLENYGYSPFSKNFFTVGGGGHAVKGRFLLGGEGGSLLGNSETAGNSKSTLIMGYGMFNIGYTLISAKDFRLYPLAGIGAGAMKFTVTESSGTVSFNDILETPGRSSVMSSESFILSISLGADYVISLSGNEEERGGPYIGVRAGYTLSPFSSKLKLDDADVTGAPEMGFSGLFIKVLIGGGAYVK